MSINWPDNNLDDGSQVWRRKVEEGINNAARAGEMAATNSKAAEKGARATRLAIIAANLDIADAGKAIEQARRVPAAPSDPAASSDAYFDEYGYPKATAYATVAKVTTDVTDAAITVVRYELFGRPNVAGESWAMLAEEIVADEANPQLKAVGLPAGEDWAFKVRAVSDAGVAGEFSAEVVLTLAKDETPPPKPNGVTGTSRLGQVIISWLGTFAGGAASPADLSHAEVLIATTAGGIGYPFGKMEANGTFVTPEIPYGTTYYYSVVAVDFSGNRSVESDRVPVTVQSVVETDIIGRVIDGANIVLDSIQENVIAAGAITEEKLSVDVTGKIDGAVADVAAAQEAADQAALDASAAGDAAAAASTAAQDAIDAAFAADQTANNAWNAASVAVVSTVLEYAASSSSTVAPTTGWSTTPPTYTSNTFIWQRTIVTYGSGSTTTTTPVLVTGNEGPAGADGTGIEIAGSVATYGALPTTLGPSDAGKGYLVESDGLLYIWSGTAFPSNGNGVAFKGDPGEPGDPGSPGAPGVSVSSVQVYYRTTAAGAAAPSAPTVTTPPAPWATTEPAYTANTDLWAVTRIGYSNTTFSYTPVSKVSAYTAASQAVTNAATAQSAADAAATAAAAAQLEADSIKAKGTDLIINGDASLGSLNFSPPWVLEVGDQPPGTAGAFYPGTGATNQVRKLDDFVPIDPAKPILASMWVKQVNAGVVSRCYFGLEPYDIDGLGIIPNYYGEVAGTRTTLTAPLSAGQTTVQVTSTAGWPNAARPIIIWDYVDGKGKRWAAGEYSRLLSAYGVGGISGNTVTLTAPWAGATVPAGTSLSVGITGGTFMYAPGITNALVPEVATRLVATTPFSGVHTNLSVAATTAFPIAATQAKVVILANYGVSGGTSKQLFSGLSLSEANAAQLRAAQAKTAADAAQATATAAQTAAGNAQTTANQAQVTASGKSKTYRALTLPSGVGTAEEDTWEMWTSLAAGGKLLAFWSWRGGAWVKGTLDESYIPLLNIGSGTYGSLVGSRLVALSVTADEIAANAIAADKIAANAVTAVKISASAVTAEKIEANAVIAAKIAAGAVTTVKLDAEAVTAEKVAANAITTVKLDAFAVTAAKIIAGAIETDKIAANAVTADKIIANAVTADKIAALSVEAGKIAANAVTADKIDAGAVTTVKLDALAVTAEKIAALAITADKIAANAITATKIAADAIDGKTITGALIRSSATGARTELTSSGLRSLNSSNQDLVRIGYGVPTGMEVRNPSTGTMVPLANAAFGLENVSQSNQLSLTVYPTSNPTWGAFTRHPTDNCVLTFTAVASTYIVNFAQSWIINYAAGTGFNSLIAVGLKSNNADVTVAGVKLTSSRADVRSWEATPWARVSTAQGVARIQTTPGTTYSLMMDFSVYAIANTSGSGQIFLQDRLITATPVFQ